MKNNQLTWGITVLVAYRYLGTLCSSLDKIIKNTALNSYYTGGNWDEKKSIINISNKIMKLSNQKIDYINIKVLVEKILTNLNKNYAKVLILKYVKELNVKTICNLLNVIERKYYRMVARAQSEFSKKMVEFGYPYQKMEIMYGEDYFIKSILDLINNKKDTIDEIVDFKDDFISNYVYSLARRVIA